MVQKICTLPPEVLDTDCVSSERIQTTSEDTHIFIDVLVKVDVEYGAEK